MSGAAYQYDTDCTNAETYERKFQLLKADGSLVNVANYDFEYSVKDCGSVSLLTKGNGLTVDIPTATITISPGVDYRFHCGVYPHGFRQIEKSTGHTDQIFDGSLTVTEGNFNGQ